MSIMSVLDEILVRRGDTVTVDKATTTVASVGVTAHPGGSYTPIVVLSDGRRITGEAAFYVV